MAANVQKIIKDLEVWARTVHDKVGTAGVFLFGSLVYQSGAQFGSTSDVDLVVVIPEHLIGAYERAQWLRELQQEKILLEIALLKLLGRADPKKQICSLVAITTIELAADLHKGGSPNFFSENQFRDLLTGADQRGIPTAGTKGIEEKLATECFRFVQQKRNKYLGITADGSIALPPFSGDEPLAKDVARHAAMARELTEPVKITGAEFDVQRGLDFISHFLYELNRRYEYFSGVQNRLSVRRGARGQMPELSPDDQILICEVIYSIVRKYLVAAERAKAEAVPALRGKQSTVLFAERFSQAFPGVAGIKWFTEAEDIRVRLERLLCEPLDFSDATPIWWWRGHANNSIKFFKYLSDGVFLMDVYELKIARIAAVSPGAYNRSFVYVETVPMSPTGLYADAAERIAEVAQGASYFPYESEEFGLVDGCHLVSRGEYDDGAAVIEGKLQDIRGRNELRVRYTTPYNFLIAANRSPINNNKYDERSSELLNLMLNGQDQLGVLMAEVLRLPLRSY